MNITKIDLRELKKRETIAEALVAAFKFNAAHALTLRLLLASQAWFKTVCAKKGRTIDELTEYEIAEYLASGK